MRTDKGQSIPDIAAAGLDSGEVAAWLKAEPGATGDSAAARHRFGGYWRKSAGLVARLPQVPRRNERERAAARDIVERARAARVRFLASHGDAIYDALTSGRSRFVRVERLV